MLRRMPADSLPKHVGRDARRQPPLGQGRRRATPRTATVPVPPTSSRCSAGATRSASRSSPCGCSPPTTSTGPSERAARRCWRSSRRPSTPSPTERRWRVHPVGALDLLPAATAARLKAAEEATRDVDGHAGQRRRRVRRAPRDRRRRPLAAAGARRRGHRRSRSSPTILDVEHIAEHLYTKGQPDPDLVIRTSGEQRLGGFLLWQSAQVGVLLLRGLLARLPPGRLPARHPRLRRSASAASAPEGLAAVTLPSPQRLPGVHPPHSGVSPHRAGRGVLSAASASGEARRIGRPVRERSRLHRTAARLPRDGEPALRRSGPSRSIA